MSKKSVLDVIKWDEALEHYESRMEVHGRLLTLYENKETRKFSRLLVGISHVHGNYSARDHGLGDKILSNNENAEERLFVVAGRLRSVTNANEVPDIIRKAGLKYFAIGVGSEASCMLNPDICWIANIRSIWTHLVFNYNGDFNLANEMLDLYRNGEATGEIAYRNWAAIHGSMNGNLTEIVELGSKLAKKASVEPGKVKYLWADAIANALYAYHHEA